MILFLAGLQEIPEELYEAADIDGANGWNKFRYITMPSLKGVTTLVIILQTIASFKLFGQTFLITNGGPGWTRYFNDTACPLYLSNRFPPVGYGLCNSCIICIIFHYFINLCYSIKIADW